MTANEIQRHMYRVICSDSEVERIMDVKTARDHLLKLRADTISDHTRLTRVFLNRRRMFNGEWSLEKSFDESHFNNFVKRLSTEDKAKCEQVTCGNIFSNVSNGLIFSTEFGPVSTISDSLQYFLKFMHLGLFEYGAKVPVEVRMNAIRIAIRVMLQTESLDFLMDPRGIIPKKIALGITQFIPYELQFIAGHEYAHFLLGHLDDNETSPTPILRALRSHGDDYGVTKAYNFKQKRELEADLAAINLPHYTKKEKALIEIAALTWYCCLDVYETVEAFMFPPIGVPEHPPAKDRLFNILNNVSGDSEIDIKYWSEIMPPMIARLKERLINDASLNTDNYEMYGSVYLDKPNTKWRGRELIDRVDY